MPFQPISANIFFILNITMTLPTKLSIPRLTFARLMSLLRHLIITALRWELIITCSAWMLTVSFVCLYWASSSSVAIILIQISIISSWLPSWISFLVILIAMIFIILIVVVVPFPLTITTQGSIRFGIISALIFFLLFDFT